MKSLNIKPIIPWNSSIPKVGEQLSENLARLKQSPISAGHSNSCATMNTLEYTMINKVPSPEKEKQSTKESLETKETRPKSFHIELSRFGLENSAKIAKEIA